MVCPDWFPFSAGLAESCYNTRKQLEKHGHSVRVIVAKDENVDHKDLEVIEIPYAIRLLGRNPIALNLWHKVKSHVEWGDVVCLFSYMYEMNSRLVWFRKIGKFQKPIVHFYRGSLESDASASLGPVTKLAKIIYDRTCGALMFKHVDHTISNSGPTLEVIKKQYGVPAEKLSYVKNALNSDKYPKWRKENKNIIFVGRLIENKGVKLFENIIKVIPPSWNFIIVGDGPMEDEVNELASRYKNIIVKGKVSHKECMKLVSESDINILPTYAEGSPRTVMEASASGIPSISFAVGDVINTIPKECGYAIKPFDIDDFCDKLKKLIENKSLRQRMGKKAKTFAEKELGWNNIYPKIEKVLQKYFNDNSRGA